VVIRSLISQVDGFLSSYLVPEKPDLMQLLAAVNEKRAERYLLSSMFSQRSRTAPQSINILQTSDKGR